MPFSRGFIEESFADVDLTPLYEYSGVRKITIFVRNPVYPHGFEYSMMRLNLFGVSLARLSAGTDLFSPLQSEHDSSGTHGH